MKQSKILLRSAIFVLLALSVARLLFGDPLIYWNNAMLRRAVTALPEGETTLEAVAPFVWDAAFTFEPYTSRETIASVVGDDSPAIRESVSEGMTQLIFTRRGAVVCSVCAYPDALGYAVDFAGLGASYPAPDGGYPRIEAQSGAKFSVTHENNIVLLTGVSSQ